VSCQADHPVPLPGIVHDSLQSYDAIVGRDLDVLGVDEGVLGQSLLHLPSDFLVSLPLRLDDDFRQEMCIRPPWRFLSRAGSGSAQQARKEECDTIGFAHQNL
jgi:hypothetical protein